MCTCGAGLDAGAEVVVVVVLGAADPALAECFAGADDEWCDARFANGFGNRACEVVWVCFFEPSPLLPLPALCV